jgi:hypothetical protein
MCRSDIDNAFAAFDAALIVLAQATVASEPAECAFDHPAARQNLEAFLPRRSLYDIQGDIERFAHPIDQTSILVNAVSPDLLQVRNSLRQLQQRRLGAVVILDTSGMNDDVQQIAYCIDDDVSLASIDPLEGIKSSLPASFGCLDTLGVYHPGCCVFVTPSFLAFQFAQGGIDLSPSPIQASFAVVVVDAVMIWEVFGQVFPLTTGPNQVENGVEHLAHIQFYRATSPLSFRKQQRLDDLPLLIGQVTGITLLLVIHCSPLLGMNRYELVALLLYQAGFSCGICWKHAIHGV